MRRRRTLTGLVLLVLVLPVITTPVAADTPSADAPPRHRVADSTPGFVLPTPGPADIRTPFRPPATRYGRGHRGVDLAGTVGSPIRAAGDGTVVFARSLAGRGVVSIDHPIGLRTTYEPVAAVVTAGRHVTGGSVIGTLEAGHASCEPVSCLHWGARLPDGSYIDPMGLITGLRVRLKPWDP
ncbi:Peptidase family M23 [Nakamurella panacisegetis]|uniref:Peptidase family M23 n=1 Tax=Nakamurella panacisegetis TaxID=1090615 RepID=A0A1H0RL91_9ACTN|nr:M23 family metallopeptidase [Nakamurella panacisegetis]SDP30235.1 Peptidase family M23 [Nakamurella panacisegetis]